MWALPGPRPLSTGDLGPGLGPTLGLSRSLSAGLAPVLVLSRSGGWNRVRFLSAAAAAEADLVVTRCLLGGAGPELFSRSALVIRSLLFFITCCSFCCHFLLADCRARRRNCSSDSSSSSSFPTGCSVTEAEKPSDALRRRDYGKGLRYLLLNGYFSLKRFFFIPGGDLCVAAAGKVTY